MALPIAIVGESQCGGGPGATGTGVILGPGGLGQYGDGLTVSVVGDLIAPHGPSPHDAGVIIQGSPDTFINGIPLVHIGDATSCGCTVLLGDEDTFCLP
jgi:uncharacterized Zn-binding protein involved in type VI secretion